MLVSVEGTYRDGKVDLKEVPAAANGSRVIVTFLANVAADPEPAPPPQYLTLGMFKGDRMTDEEDFKIAEWRGDPEDPDGE